MVVEPAPRIFLNATAVTMPEVEAAATKAKERCATFNKLFDDPIASLQLYQRTGMVSIIVHEEEGEERDIPAAQRAFLALSDRIKHDRLRFGAGAFGSVWADFTDDDEVEWRAALNPERPPPPSNAAYEIMLCKLSR